MSKASGELPRSIELNILDVRMEGFVKNVSPEITRQIIEERQVRLLQLAQEQQCAHPFRLTATDAFNRIIWLAGTQLDAEKRTVIVDRLPQPQWGLVEFPVTFTLADAKGKELVMKIQEPQQEYVE